jgi:hypothetical protein
VKGEITESDEYLTPKEIAERIGLKTARPVNDAINRGELPAFEPSYNHRIVRGEDFRVWMDSKRVKPSVAVASSYVEFQTGDLAEALVSKTKKATVTAAASASPSGQTLHGLI